ncbi:MAG: hypothetical protein AAFN77_13715 [Planctomycetota bacterium]
MLFQSLKKVPVVFAAAAFLCPLAQSTVAQDHFIGENQPVKRVIQLQPQTGAPIAQKVDNTVSRVLRNEFQPTTPKVGFEEIKVPDVLQKAPAKQADNTLQPIPVSKTNLPQAAISTQQLSSGQTSATPTSSPIQIQGNVAPIQKSYTPAMPAKYTNKPASVTPAQPGTKSPSTLTSKAESLIKTTIQSPKFINVNKQAPIKITVSNAGQTDVENVKFQAMLPTHTKLVSASPQPVAVDGQIVQFQLDRIGGRDTREIILQLIPTTRKAIDIATSVRTENNQKVLIAVRQPQLSLVINGPRQANIGEKITHEVIVSNMGDGVAENVQLNTLFPPSLIELNSTLTESIKAIEPGKSVKVKYVSQAVAAGPIALKTSAQSDDGTEPKLASIDMNVFEPKLQISAIGPKINFVDRNGIYTIKLENPGKVDITDVRVALGVPTGMKITTISREANVDASKGILRWNFDKIPAGSTEQIQMMAVVTEEGAQVCHILVDSHETSEKEIQLSTQVTTRADVAVQIKNDSGPVQVGGKATFTVEVSNRGSRKAMDVNVRVDLPASLKAVPLDSQKVVIDGNSILFTEPQIASGKKVSFQFSAIGQVSGEHLVRSMTQIEGSERTTTAEDTVFVYEVDEARVSESLTPEIPRR